MEWCYKVDVRYHLPGLTTSGFGVALALVARQLSTGPAGERSWANSSSLNLTLAREVTSKGVEEELTVYAPIIILIRLLDHLVNLGVSQVLTQRLHDLAKFVGGDGAAAVFVEDGEGGARLLVDVDGLEVGGHHLEELVEVDGTGLVDVDFVDHVAQFAVGGVLA